MSPFNRRRFLKRTALASASLAALPSLRVLGANDDIRVGVVGFNSRGRAHIDGLRGIPGVRIVALCDVDRGVLGRTVQQFADRGEKVEGYEDIRKLLERKDIDAIATATPNHWHALATIWAVQAGKDVYVEKPVSHNIFEGRKMVEAARKHGRMVQTGSQCRSNPGIIEAIQWVRAGNLGKILRARGLCYKRRDSIGKVGSPQAVPSQINYDLWCGPAPLDPPRRNSKKFGPVHYDWHWLWAYGNGDLGNQGVHQMDLARWVLGETTLAPKSFSIGGRLGYEDDGETPNTHIIFQQYEKAPLIFEVRGLPTAAGSDQMDHYRGASIGVVVDCEGGSLVIPGYERATAFDPAGKEIKRFSGGADHFANFIKAVRSRKHTDLTADIEEGHLSAALCHTANISYRLGKTLPPDALRDAIKTDAEAAGTLGRMEQHLAANRVDLKRTPATLGALLTVDVKSERFIGNDAANQLLTREYRKPFVVPEKV